MNYPPEFAARVKKMYPGEETARMVDTGNTFLGRVLDDSSSDNISAKKVLELVKSDQDDYAILEQLEALAQNAIQGRRLYGEWVTLYQAEFGR